MLKQDNVNNMECNMLQVREVRLLYFRHKTAEIVITVIKTVALVLRASAKIRICSFIE